MAEDATVVKRRPGRPRKNPETQAVEPTAEPVEAAEKPAKKRCGDANHVGRPLVSTDKFHQKKDGADGLAWRCKDCAIRAAKESEQRKRERIGEEAWKQVNREKRAINRARQKAGDIKDYDRRQQGAHRTALARLAANHPREFDKLYLEAKIENGLPATLRRRTKVEA